MDQQNQTMRLVLSTDAKPRLKWTHELHQKFTDAINQLGGAEKATPKSLMRAMAIPGLTLYHLKSHLQKYRLGKNQLVETCSDEKQDYIEIQSSDSQCSREISVANANQTTDLKIAEALEIQMEVQKKLYEQIEVQKHLQFRIEAQGKYLQSVLMKAQEALAGYGSSSSSVSGVEHAKAELSQLLSTINNNACPSSPISELTETRGLSLNFGERKQNRGTMCSLSSSLTSSESSERKDEKQTVNEAENTPNYNSVSFELPLMDIGTNDGASGRKRSAVTDFDCGSVDQPDGKKLKESEVSQMLDLNSKYEREIESCSLEIDLNCSSSF
ncbi:myb family transcription factor PHL8-like isoform X2 [Vicia villosa]|uniref:myb family transcription factor PHL8-like isoform X2 n=1 Tax=Vicia villosa TaxID=3911 RepID=UPI00273B4494|nr:myb family transcription factor PHL8-like isoform X2 [Vicia villosa]